MSDTANRTDFHDEFDSSIPFTTGLLMKRENSERGVFTNVPHLVVHHSPDGFEFGYGGSGAADLALNACQLYLNIVEYSGQKTKCYDGTCWTLAWMLHQEFKRQFIEGVNRHKGEIVPFERMERWFEAHMTGQLLNECAIETEED